MEFLNHLFKKLFMSFLIDDILYELDMKDLQKYDYQTCNKKVSWSFIKELPYSLKETEESIWWNFPLKGRTDFQISWFMKKSAAYYGSVDRRWRAQCYKRMLADCTGKKISLSLLKVFFLASFFIYLNFFFISL